ncbi:hypothetical protein PM082_015706 [Marasmius tenuissimus]|nr:hypothetical protein PM082_015706 [Marasmius tenuissimus]
MGKSLGTHTVNRGRDQIVQNGAGGSRVNNNHGGQPRTRTVVNIYNHSHPGGKSASSPPSVHVSSHTTPHSSRGSSRDPSSTRSSEPESTPQLELLGDNCTERTHSELYESLLLRCKLRFPLWDPSPRCTLGEEFVLEIGDVGFLSPGLPFHTLFNITQTSGSPANRDRIPKGFNSCLLESQDVMLKKRFHSSSTTLFQSKGAISKQKMDPPSVISRLLSPFYSFAYNTLDFHLGATSSVFTYDLSEKEGALLLLPHGSTLQKLDNTAKFMEYVRLHWEQWYSFADGQVDRNNGQALYLVTGVERCTTWALAAWDSNASYTRDDLGSLKLTVDGITGACHWAFPPARCFTQSSDPPASNSSEPNQTVFIRGFWIDRANGTLQPSIPPSEPGARNDDDKDGSPKSGGNSRKQPPAGGPSSGPSSTCSTFPNDGNSGGPDPHFDSLDPQIDETSSLGIKLYFPDESSNLLSRVTHPCRVINKFALNLVSYVKPDLLDSGCAAFSHDDDWIGVIQDSDGDFLPEVEIIRRICSNFKFTIEGDAICPVSMDGSEKGLLERRKMSLPQGRSSAIPVLVELDNAIVSPVGPTARSRGDSDVRAGLHRSGRESIDGGDQDVADRGGQISQLFGGGGVDGGEGRNSRGELQTTIVDPYESLQNVFTGAGASHKAEQQLGRGACFDGTYQVVLSELRVSQTGSLRREMTL